MASFAGRDTGAEAADEVHLSREERLKNERLRKCYTKLQDEIEAPLLVGHMYENGALSRDDMDEIRKTQPPTRRMQATVLLDMVLRGKPAISMYDVLVDALSKSGYSELVTKLAETHVDVESETGDVIKHPKTKSKTLPKLLEVKIKSAKKVFVETKSYCSVRSSLEKNGYVTITGGSGSGKTTMALMLMEEYRQRDHAVFFIENIEDLDLDKMVEIKQPKLLVIDDVMGSVSATQDRIVAFNKVFDFLADMLQNTSSTSGSDMQDHFQNEKNIKVIFTSKTWLLKESKCHIKHHLYSYFTQSVDLSNSQMSEQELKDILSKHLTNKGHSVSQDDVSKICTNISKEGDTALGFPYVCQLFSSMDVFCKGKDPVTFFQKPMKFLKSELESLFKTDKMKKACFMLMVLCDGHLSLSSLMDSDTRQKSGLEEKVKIIQNYTGDCTDKIQPFCSSIKTTAETLTDTLLKTEDDNVSFLHASTHDATAYLLGKENISFIINHCSMKVINERIRVKVGSTKGKPHDEGSDFLITISEANHEMLAKRLAKELCNKQFAISLSHQAFSNLKVKKLVFDSLSEKNELTALIHSHDTLYEAHFLFWASLFNHKYLLTQILSLGNFTTEELLWGILATCVNGKGEGFDTITSKDPSVKEQLLLKTVEDITVNVMNEKVTEKFQNYFKLTSSSYLEFKGTCGLIHVAAAFGHKMIVEKLLEAGACVNSTTESGVTPLMLACLHGHLELVKMLLDKGAEYMVTSKIGNCSIHFACLGNQTEVIEMLCTLCIDINFKGKANWTPLLYSCRYGDLRAVKLLLKYADKTVVTDTGLTCLHLASCNGNKEIVQMFLSEDMDVNCVGNNLKTPLMYACFEGQTQIAEMLLDNGADITKTDASCKTCLHYACYKSENSSLIKKLLQHDIDINCKSEKGWTPLCYACRYGNVEIVNLLLFYEADKNVLVDNGLNCLHLAALGGSVHMVDTLLESEFHIESQTTLKETPLLWACIEGQIEVVEFLIENSADICACDHYGRNALHLVCKAGYLNIAKLLLELGMDVDARDADGWTPLLFASRYAKADLVEHLLSVKADENVNTKTGLNCLHLACCDGNTEKVELLLFKGWDVNSTTDKGKTPLMYCCHEGKVTLVDILVAKGADLFIYDKENRNCMHYACLNKYCNEFLTKLIDYEMDINCRGENGWTPVLFLSRYGSVRVVELLKNRGADMTVVSDSGLNCLHMAACNSDVRMVEMFLCLDFDIDSRSKKGKTPLMYACETGRTDVAQLLITKKADVLARDASGKNCYDWLQTDKFREFAQMLEENYPELLNTAQDKPASQDQVDASSHTP
ncbi:uncharacterized protein LOC121368269 [Gigantopelta aegis]|uniref:uncharacterized protein LOC121368269 n=1 Tax=Gigantopelta aegis TaxID=1735272 RepID=UPI001B888317|nr:uncharacterized protein LOC121368269 [Gigantopelta aegis]